MGVSASSSTGRTRPGAGAGARGAVVGAAECRRPISASHHVDRGSEFRRPEATRRAATGPTPTRALAEPAGRRRRPCGGSGLHRAPWPAGAGFQGTRCPPQPSALAAGARPRDPRPRHGRPRPRGHAVAAASQSGDRLKRTSVVSPSSLMTPATHGWSSPFLRVLAGVASVRTHEEPRRKPCRSQTSVVDSMTAIPGLKPYTDDEKRPHMPMSEHRSSVV